MSRKCKRRHGSSVVKVNSSRRQEAVVNLKWHLSAQNGLLSLHKARDERWPRFEISCQEHEGNDKIVRTAMVSG